MTPLRADPGAGGPLGTGAALPPSSTRAGHHARPVDLPGDGNTAGLARYLDTICGITEQRATPSQHRLDRVAS